MLLRGFKHYNRIYIVQKWLVEQNPVILNINSGAKTILYIYHTSEQIVFIRLYIVHIFEQHVEV